MVELSRSVKHFRITETTFRKRYHLSNGAVLDADLAFDGTHKLASTIAFGNGGTLVYQQQWAGMCLVSVSETTEL